MKKIYIAIVLISIWILTGCSTKSSFYQLHPKTAHSYEGKIGKKGIIIGIGEVEVADYLDKLEMVTRLSTGRVNVHDDKRWAGSFTDNIQSVLLSDISQLLPRYTFLAYPWEEPISDQYRIYVTIDRFDGSANGVVTLHGRWSIVVQQENQVLFGESIHYTQRGGTTLDQIVDTQSRLLEKLSRRIASRVRARIVK